MSRHYEACVVEGCKKIPEGKICVMHKSRWKRHGSYADPRTIKINNPNHNESTLKICKKHGNLEHKNIYTVPKSGHMMCKLCQEHNRKRLAASKKLKENYYNERKNLLLLICSHCTENKKISSFTKYWLSRKNPLCIDCHRKFGRKSLLKLNFNMTLDEYDALVIKQNNRCAICNNEETVIHHSTKKISCLSVDHDHKTNKNRGLLCQLCNFGIGYFKDSPSLMRKAALYMEEHA